MQANCTDRIRHNKDTVVATGFELGCATVPELQCATLRFLSKRGINSHTQISTD